MRILERRLERFFGEYFLGTEAHKWYNTQRHNYRESILDGDALRRRLRASVIEEAEYIVFGRIVPNALLFWNLYSSENTRNQALAAVFLTELTRAGWTLYNRRQRKPYRMPAIYIGGAVEKSGHGENQG